MSANTIDLATVRLQAASPFRAAERDPEGTEVATVGLSDAETLSYHVAEASGEWQDDAPAYGRSAPATTHAAGWWVVRRLHSFRRCLLRSCWGPHASRAEAIDDLVRAGVVEASANDRGGAR